MKFAFFKKPAGKKSAKKQPFLDGEGKLFGKWDLFKPLFAVVILILAILIVRVLLQKDTYITAELFASGGEWWWDNPDPPYWLTDPIQAGAVEYDPQGNVLVEVLEVRKFEAGDRKRLWMKVRLKVTPTGKSQQYRFRREPLQIGRVIRISPNNIYVNASVAYIEGIGGLGEPIERLLTLKSYDIYPWHEEQIVVGNKMVDSNGVVLAEIVGKETRLAETITTDDQGRIHLARNPLRRDVDVKIKVKGKRLEGIDYFADFQPLKVGFYVFFPFDTVNVDGAIAQVEPIGE
jgi:hypothetical protein